MASTLSEFTAELHKRNIARSNRYYVELTMPKIFETDSTFDRSNTRLVSMWCHAASTPQTTIMTDDDYITDGTRRKFAYDVDFQNLNLSFYVDQNYEIKKFFDQWKQAIVPQRRRFNYPKDYTAAFLNVVLLNQEDQPVYKYEYTNVYPKSFNMIDLNYAPSMSPTSFSIDFVFEDVYYSSLNANEIVIAGANTDILVDSTSKPPENVTIDNGSVEFKPRVFIAR